MSNQYENRNQEKEFYETFWQPQIGLSCDEKCRRRFILSEVKRRAATLGTLTPGVRPRIRIADVGCGRGWLTHLMSALGETTGFDRSVTEARKRYPENDFVECDALDLPPNDFDIAVCSEVIEHVRTDQQQKLIEKLFSILGPRGFLVMTTPNKPQVSRLIDELSLQSELQPIENWLDAGALRRLVSTRFEIERFVTIMFFPVGLRKIRSLSRIYRAMYEQMYGYRAVDPLLQKTMRGLYLGLAGRRMKQKE